VFKSDHGFSKSDTGARARTPPRQPARCWRYSFAARGSIPLLRLALLLRYAWGWFFLNRGAVLVTIFLLVARESIF